MTNPALDARLKAQEIWAGATVFARQRNGILHRHPVDFSRFMLDLGMGWGGWHYGASATNEVETDWITSIDPAWQYQMSESDYEVHARDFINAGNVLRYREPVTGEYVMFQPLALNWVDNITNSRQQLRLPQSVQAIPVGDTLKWVNGYGAGMHFTWLNGGCQLVKLLAIDEHGYLPTATVANPYLELEFILSDSGVDVYADGVLWDRSSTVQTINALEYRSQTTGQPLWYFTNPGGYDAEGKHVQGIFQVRRQGGTRYCTIRIPKTWVDAAVFPIYLDPTVDKQVGAGADDTEDSTAGWDNNAINNSIGYQTPPGIIYDSSYRFTGVTVSGTVNADTYMQVSAGTNYTSPASPIVAKIYAEDASNPSAPTDQTDFQGRTLTTANADWSTSASWTVDTFYNTAGLQSVVQELVDSYTLSSTAMQFFIMDNSSTSYRIVRTYDAGATKGAKLHIDYTAGVSDLSIDKTDSLTLADIVTGINTESQALGINIDPDNYGGAGWKHGVKLWP